MRNHRRETIYNWKKRGVISDDYHELYDIHMSKNNCELCGKLFDDSFKNQRCLDHDHNTCLYRMTLCRGCNANYKLSKPKTKAKTNSGFSWICINKTKNKSGNYSIGWRYGRVVKNKNIRKQFKLKSMCLAYSFIMLLKHPF